jgi:hypothetical protein
VSEDLLPTPPGYQTSAGTARIGWLAAQLDDQLRRLRRRLDGAGVELLEWQPQPGANTIGMLLAHNAITEAYWVHIAEGRVRSIAEADAAVLATLGIGMMDDGMPIPPDGGHAPSLKGAPLARYFDLLGRARATTHAALRNWDEPALAGTIAWEGRTVSRSWIAYHLLEHFAAHAGQILLLESLRERRLAEGTARS